MSTGSDSEREILTGWERIQSPDVEIVAFVARPAEATNAPALVVIPENLGITDWRQEETRRMAIELGWPVVVMSPYSRLGGEPPRGPFETADNRRRAAFLAMPDEQVARDLDATAAWVSAQSFTRDGPPALLGFCSGGGQAIYAAATRPGLVACVVSIYGNIVLRGEFTEDGTPLERFEYTQRLQCPVQLHVGSEDIEIPAAHVDRFEAELAEHGKQHEVYRYQGANHIFADERHPNYDPQATALMWPRIYSFLKRSMRTAA